MDFPSSLATVFAMILAAALTAAGQGPDRSTEQALFFSGEVVLKDGSKPPDSVRIQRVCKGVAHDETWTDSKGRFSFKVTSVWDSASPDSAQAPRNADLARPIG